MAATAPSPSDSRRRLAWAGLLLGFALGGFFDGILLHQILQWHHLLSGIEAAGARDLRFQILADGLFHALMYVIAGIGLVVLWRARRMFAAPGADRRLLADALMGFGAWHVVDAVLSHWLTGIHRIRMDSAYPLAWDLGWLAAFGLVPLAAGWLWGQRGSGDPPRPGRTAAPGLLALAIMVAGPVAALPPADVTGVVAYFGPGATSARVLAAVDAVGGRVLWSDASGTLWAIELGDEARAKSGQLYAHGALLVSGSAVPLGCLSWSRA